MFENNHLNIILVAASLLATPASAQIAIPPGSDAGALQQRRIDDEQRRLELERQQRKPIADPLRRDGPAAPTAKPAASAISFLVKEIRFTPSDIFTADELGVITQHYINQKVTYAGLQLLVEHINAEYRKRGIATAQAMLPPQDVTSGVIQIRLVEGRVGDIRIEGNTSTRESYITSRIGLSAHKLVDLQQFEDDLKLFNRANDIQLRADLKPGAYAGTTDILLSVIEPPRHNLRLTLDNSGSKSTGRERAGLMYTNRSVLGFRDDVSLSATRADGLKSYSASYGVPVNSMGGRIQFAYYKDNTVIKHGALAPLAITSESTAKILTYRQPLLYGENMQLEGTAAIKRRDSETRSSGVLLQDTGTSDMNIGLDYQRTDNSGMWSATYNAIRGSATARLSGVTTDYFIGRGSLRRTQEFNDKWSFRGAFTMQHTGDQSLPSSEQFIIGGDGSVRGFPVGAYAGDHGITVNAELHHPLGPLGRLGAAEHPLHLAATGMFFVDFGRVSPYRPPGSALRNYNEISSAGWGLNYTLGKRVYGRIVYGYAISGLPPDNSRSTVHFQLVAQLL